MSKQRRPVPSEYTPSHPWTIYLLIAIAAFASGSALTMALRPNAPAPHVVTATPGAATPANNDPVALGNSYYDQQNWTAAIAQYERAISQGIDNSDVRTDLGNAYRFSGNPRKALEQYQLAQQRDPTHEQSLFNQGSLYAQSLGDPLTGAAKWREFIARFPASPRATDANRMLAEFEKEFGAPATNSPAPVP